MELLKLLAIQSKFEVNLLMKGRILEKRLEGIIFASNYIKVHKNILSIVLVHCKYIHYILS